jgi:nicotinamidase-related amidase
MDAFLVVDMQVGMLDEPPKHDLPGVIARINLLADWVRSRGGSVLFIQHHGRAGDVFAPNGRGWPLLPALNRRPEDTVVAKDLNDAFAGTVLRATLHKLVARRLLIAGWATDFCVDATVRSAVSDDHHVVVVADGHTVSDRPHLHAAGVIRHHNWVWGNLMTRASIRVLGAAELQQEGAGA